MPFQSWEEFLGANADIVRDFKYDNKLKGSSSVMGSLIWNSETFWGSSSRISIVCNQAIPIRDNTDSENGTGDELRLETVQLSTQLMS